MNNPFGHVSLSPELFCIACTADGAYLDEINQLCLCYGCHRYAAEHGQISTLDGMGAEYVVPEGFDVTLL